MLQKTGQGVPHLDFSVNEGSKAPIYRQIADWLDGRIAGGELPAGHRLMTERELCAALNVARGTVKNAYIELERRGLIEKIQGKGTFVVGGSAERERGAAVAAIRRTMQSLRAHGLGTQELEEIIRSEAWGRLTEAEKVRVAWVDMSPELLQPAVGQIAQVCNVAVFPLLPGEAATGAGRPFDLLATSVTCYEPLCEAMTGRSVQIERVALSVSGRTVSALARLGPEERVAALYRSTGFYENLQESLRELSLAEQVDFYCVEQPLDRLYAGLSGYSAVLVPPRYPQSGSPAVLRELAESGAQVLPFEYVLDNGSLMHLKESAQRLWEKRLTGL